MKRKIIKLFFSLVLVLSFGLTMALPAMPAVADVTVTLQVASYGNGSVTSPGQGTFTYTAGTSITLVAVANSGSAFLSWIGDIDTIGDPNAATTSILMNGNYSIYAYFSGTSTTPTTYTITATADANGSITPSGGTTVSSGGSQTYYITANSGYRIANVLVDGLSQGAVATYTFSSVTAGHTISASFVLNTFTITPTAGANGSISPPGVMTVNYGGSQAYTITPGTGYHITDVKVDGASVGAVATYTFSNVTAVHTIAASFAINTYAITATSGANGSITPSGAQTVNYGSGQAFTITPNTGYHIADVLVDGASVGASANYTFSNVTAVHTIAVSFAINTYIITPTAGDHGAISPFTAVTVNYGDSQTFTIAADTFYRIAEVKVDGAPMGALATYTFSNVTAVHTIDATFTIGWPFYVAFGLGVVLVFLLGFWAGRSGGGAKF